MDLSLDRIAEATRAVDPAFLRTPQYAERAARRGDGAPRHRQGGNDEPAAQLQGPRRRLPHEPARSGADRRVLVDRQLRSGDRRRRAMSEPGGGSLRAGERQPGEAGADAGVRRTRHAGRSRLRGGRRRGPRARSCRRRSHPRRGWARDGDCGGAGTIGVELLASGPFDAIVVPVGDGALIAGIALWVKAQRRRRASSASAPAGRQAWPRAGGRGVRCRRRRRAPSPRASRSACPCPNPSRGSSSSSTTWCWWTTTTSCRRCDSRWTRLAWSSSHPAPPGWRQSRGSGRG